MPAAAALLLKVAAAMPEAMNSNLQDSKYATLCFEQDHW
jgi:hypothetical protein